MHGGRSFRTYRCRCSCPDATERNVLEGALRSGKSTSCGCRRREMTRARTIARNASKGIVGPANPRWKGGRNKTRHGYVEVWISRDDPLFGMARSMTGAGGYVFEHRLVVARALGRPLDARENVHHVNGKRDDNRLKNLQVLLFAQPAGQCYRCRSCGSHDIATMPLP